MEDLVLCRDTLGRVVAEVDLDTTTMTVAEIVRHARAREAEVVWAHGGDPGDGFVPMRGYAHLHADRAAPGEPLREVRPDEYGAVLRQAYLGLWGHKWVERTKSLPTDGSIVLCLEEDGPDDDTAVGLCRVWPDERLVDQPGVVPERRSPDRSLRLLGAACAVLGAGPVDVDSWGESREVLRASAALGFAVTEETAGWELAL
jgi:hypothetical protein